MAAGISSIPRAYVIARSMTENINRNASSFLISKPVLRKRSETVPRIVCRLRLVKYRVGVNSAADSEL